MRSLIFTPLVLLALILVPDVLADDGKNPDPAWKQALHKSMETKKITVDFTDTRLEDVIQFTKQVGNLPLVVDPRSKLGAKTVTINIKDVSIKTFLTTLQGLYEDVSFGYSCGQMIVTTAALAKTLPLEPPAKPARLSEAHAKLWDKVAGRKVTVDFSRTPFGDFIQFMRETSGVNMVADRALTAPGKNVTLSMSGTKVLTVLTLASVLVGAQMSFKDGVFVFKPAPKPRPSPTCADCKGKLGEKYKFCPWCGKAVPEKKK